MNLSEEEKKGNPQLSTKKIELNPSLFAILFVVGLILRLLNIPSHNMDMIEYTKWYDYIAQHGIINAMGDEFSIYAPPYLYLLSLATLTQPFLSKLAAIKLIPIIFDVLNTFLVYKIISISFKEKTKPLLAAILFWLAPTVAINSSFWGQTDSLYLCLLLVCVYFLMKNQPIAAIVGFGIGLAIKVQAIFLSPLLIVLFLKRRISWSTFLLIPLTYFVVMLPAFLAGRSIQSLISIYYNQGVDFIEPSLNAANPYFFLPENMYESSFWVGLSLATVIILAWILLYGLKKYEITPSIILLHALTSVALVPFVLPKMHDRYFYAADVFSIITFFHFPQLWIVPIAYQIISLLSYLPFLVFGADPQKTIPVAAFINTVTIGYLLWKQWKLTFNDDVSTPQHLSQSLEK